MVTSGPLTGPATNGSCAAGPGPTTGTDGTVTVADGPTTKGVGKLAIVCSDSVTTFGRLGGSLLPPHAASIVTNTSNTRFFIIFLCLFSGTAKSASTTLSIIPCITELWKFYTLNYQLGNSVSGLNGIRVFANIF